MFTLREFSKENESLESNSFLGKNYQVISRERNPEFFRKVYQKVFGKPHVSDLDEKSDKSSKNCQGFISDENGNFIYLNKRDTYYIMSSDGRTYDNITYR